MNKTAIKNFAVWARKKLISDIKYKAGMLGITENGIAEKLPQSTHDLQFFDIGTKNYSQVSGVEIKQRDGLIKAIRNREEKSFKDAFDNTVEEIAYTWFNRLIAIRFMEVNDYLPSGVRVLSSNSKDKIEPDFVTTPFEADLDLTQAETDAVTRLKDENKLDELFRMLFIKQCNKLNFYLPELFEKTDDYTELMLTISFTDKDGVVYHLVHDIPEDDFNVVKEGQVEIIGWLYQYYNTEPKDKVFADLKKNKKIEKENIPAATQLFTPDWIVRYMVENSLGRLWVDGHDFPHSEWKYYLDDAEQTDDVKAQLAEIRESRTKLKPEQIRFIDPCMGSGHILVYAFDVLMQIYLSCGYAERDAVRSIVCNNLYGLDIDKRAYQLAYFAVMMKAKQYDSRLWRRIEGGNFEKNLPNLSYFQDMPAPNYSLLDEPLRSFAQQFKNADTYGSLITVQADEGLDDAVDKYQSTLNLDYKQIEHLMRLYKILSQKYDVVCTNPPYMGNSGMNALLSEFVKKNYPDSKSDLFACFIERCGMFAKKHGYYAMITQHAWMFLSSYEKLREKLSLVDTVNMVHLGARAFDEIGGEVVQTTSFVMRDSHIKDYFGTYCRLTEPTTQQGKEDMFLAGENRYNANQENFSKIPGAPVAYWVSENVIKAFENKSINNFGDPKQGIIPGNVNEFVRIWYEVNFMKIGFNHQTYEDICKFNYKWFPYNKGGSFRRWYGNIEHLINMYNNGHDIKFSEKNNNYRLREPQLYFKEAITWSKISSGAFSARYMTIGNLFDIAGCCIFFLGNNLKYILGFTNSVAATIILNLISPTLNYEVDHIKKLPIIIDESKKPAVEKLVQENIDLSKQDWDSFETSWDFKKHPLVPLAYERKEQLNAGMNSEERTKSVTLLSERYRRWAQECDDRFNQLKANEEELNRIFIDIYGLQDELTPDVDDKDVTVRKADLQRDIKSLISYAVGCMFGRYSLDYAGLAYAGGEWDNSKYTSFIPDDDNCIPITDEEYFKDDIVGRFVEFIRTAYGEQTLEENLNFIAAALGNKGNTSRDAIRNYFLNDFIKDHINTYQKRPIYWLFDSGKQNGLKALCYMHRWNADTTGNMRVEYLHSIQRAYENEINRMQEIIDKTHDNREKSNAEKRREKLQKQLKETKDYDSSIAHLALSRITIDLDDGVKTNYEKVQTSADGNKLQVLAKI